jgi:hypothetical protein
VNTGRALVGLALVTIGVLLLLDQQGALDAGAVIADWWPAVLLVAAGLDLLARPRRVASAVVLSLVGLVLLTVTTGLVDTDVWQLVWPVSIVAVGLWLLLRKPVPPGRAASPDETIDAVAVFSGRRVVSTAPRFLGGSATAVFGGVEIDLTGATIDHEAVLDAVALFGGVDVEVPLGWRVVMDGPAIFGGHESKVPAPEDPDAPTLRIRGTAIFGGVEAKLGTTVRVPPAPLVRS